MAVTGRHRFGRGDRVEHVDGRRGMVEGIGYRPGAAGSVPRYCVQWDDEYQCRWVDEASLQQEPGE